MKKQKYIYVDLWEYERGWGSSVFDTRKYKRRHAAEAYVKKVNSENTDTSAPDYYIVARIRE